MLSLSLQNFSYSHFHLLTRQSKAIEVASMLEEQVILKLLESKLEKKPVEAARDFRSSKFELRRTEHDNHVSEN